MILGLQFEEDTCIKCREEDNEIIEYEPETIAIAWNRYVEEELANLPQSGQMKVGILLSSVSQTEVALLESFQDSYGLFKLFTKEEAILGFLSFENSWLERGNVGLFDYSGDGLFYYSISKKQDKILMQDYDLSHYVKPGCNKDVCFGKAAKDVLAKGVTSVVFLCGGEFAGNWLKDSITILCSGRRAFLGNHIYTKGMIYALKLEEQPEESVIMTEHVTPYHIALRAINQGQEVLYPIVKAGQPWFETKGEAIFVIENASYLSIVKHHAYTEEKIIEKLPLWKNRGNYITKVKVKVEYLSSTKCKVSVHDLGFGSLKPSTYRIFQKVLTVSEEM